METRIFVNFREYSRKFAKMREYSENYSWAGLYARLNLLHQGPQGLLTVPMSRHFLNGGGGGVEGVIWDIKNPVSST